MPGLSSSRPDPLKKPAQKPSREAPSRLEVQFVPSSSFFAKSSSFAWLSERQKSQALKRPSTNIDLMRNWYTVAGTFNLFGHRRVYACKGEFFLVDRAHRDFQDPNRPLAHPSCCSWRGSWSHPSSCLWKNSENQRINDGYRSVAAVCRQTAASSELRIG